MNRFSRSASRDSTEPFASEGFCASIHHLAASGLASKARTDSINKIKKYSGHALRTIGYDFSLGSWRQRPVELNIRKSLRTFGSSPWTAALLRGLVKAQAEQVQLLDEHVNYTHRVVLRDEVVKTFRYQRYLMAILGNNKSRHSAICLQYVIARRCRNSSGLFTQPATTQAKFSRA